MTSPDETLRAPAPEPEADPGEAEAWARVVAAWEDEAAHDVYLARFQDLPGLALAGRRYRDAAAARPDDPVAARMRDEVIRRATVQGFALLPRSAPAKDRSVALRRLLVAVAAALLVAAAYFAFHLLAAPPGAPS